MAKGLPMVVPVKLDGGMITAFGNLAARRNSFLLDSATNDPKKSRYSFAGINPVHTFSSTGGFVTIDGRTVIDNPYIALQNLVAKSNCINVTDPYLPFAGGLVGFISFEWGNNRGSIADLSDIPDVAFGLYDTILTYDHLEKIAWISSFGLKEDGTPSASLAAKRIENFASVLQGTQPANPCTYKAYPPLNGTHPIISSLTKDRYINGVRHLKDYEYLPLFAQKFASPTHKTPWQAYLDLRRENQTAYASYLNLGDFHILSASRTCLVKVAGNNVSVEASKGAKGKSASEQEDNKRIAELKYDPEIQRSHRYVVADAMKNLNWVCENDTVEASSVANIESDTKAHHLVSHITGIKSPRISALDCLLAVLPTSSEGRISGLINKLEGTSRNVYTGTIGYISCSGMAEFNSAFRTMILKDTIGYLHAGTEVGEQTDAEEAYINTNNAANRIFELVR